MDLPGLFGVHKVDRTVLGASLCGPSYHRGEFLVVGRTFTGWTVPFWELVRTIILCIFQWLGSHREAWEGDRQLGRKGLLYFGQLLLQHGHCGPDHLELLPDAL